MAVSELMDSSRPDDAAILAAPSDKYSRGLYLYLEQKVFANRVGGKPLQPHAERRQQMLRHFQVRKILQPLLGRLKARSPDWTVTQRKI